MIIQKKSKKFMNYQKEDEIEQEDFTYFDGNREINLIKKII